MRRILIAVSLAMTTAALAQPAERPARGQRQGARSFEIDPAQDDVLQHIKAAVEPTETQWASIVELYTTFRADQRQVLMESFRASRQSGQRQQRQGERQGERRDGAQRPPPNLDRQADQGDGDRRPQRGQAGQARRGGFSAAQRQEMLDAAAPKLEPINEAFLVECRDLLGADQQEAFDSCVVDLDLSPTLGRGRGSGAGLAVGSDAPAFELMDLDGNSVTLASLAGKPVVVEFGSYTCPAFRSQVEGVKKLRAAFEDAVHVVLIYTSEAHPTDGRVSPANTRLGIEIAQHTTLDERTECAVLARDELDLGLTILVDTLEDTVTEAYSGWPNRAFIIDGEGKVISSQQWMDAERTIEILTDLLEI